MVQKSLLLMQAGLFKDMRRTTYGVTELEALGAVLVVKHFCPYLYGHKCQIIMDHEALKSLLNTPHPSGKLAHWGLATQELRISTDPIISWEEEPECRCSVKKEEEVAATDREGIANV